MLRNADHLDALLVWTVAGVEQPTAAWLIGVMAVFS
jgi:hypothetical protein